MLKKSFFYCLFIFSVIHLQYLVAEENNPLFSVDYYDEQLINSGQLWVYCGEQIVLTINANHNIDENQLIRLEFYWRKNFSWENLNTNHSFEASENEMLIRVHYMNFAMDQSSIMINFPTRETCWDINIEDSPFNEGREQVFHFKIFYNDMLISENNEIVIVCTNWSL